jgi:hypothetical protein
MSPGSASFVLSYRGPSSYRSWVVSQVTVIVACAVLEQRSRAPFIVLRVLWTCVSLHKLWDCLWSVGVLWLCKGNTPELPFWLWKCDSTVFVSFSFLVLYCPPVYIYCSGLGVSPQSYSLHCRLVALLFSLLI